MSKPLRVLIIEDSEDDTLLLVRNLHQGGFDPTYQVVENAASMQAALETQSWDVVISDYALPHFNGLEALKLLKQIGLDLPFIIVSGTIGEETAVAAMKAGAHDYLMKSNLVRLGPVVERELQEIRERHKHKWAEAALHHSEERFRQVVASISDHVYVSEVTADGGRTNRYISPNVEPLTGYPRQKFMADWHFWASSVIHPDDRTAAAEQVARLTAGQNSEMEYRLIRADGETIWVRDSARVESEGSGVKIIYGVVSDITERKQLEEQFYQSQKLDAIGRLAGGVAHDFNNILTVITGYADLLADRHSEESDPERREVEQIRKAAKQAASLTRHLLAFSRKHMLQPKVLYLNTVVTDMETMLRRLIGENIELIPLLDQKSGRIKADPGQMEQVIMNLVVNARDAMPNGGKLTIKTTAVELDEAYTRQHIGANPGPYAVLSVSDTGLGMDMQTRSRIFEPFFTTKEQGQGTGLGLAVVHGIVSQSGGFIEVYSEPGQGAIFRIFLPQVEAPVLLVTPNNPASNPARTGSETILLVEDEASVRELAHYVLVDKGYTILEAQHGQEALWVAGQHTGRIDLLLTDVVMPGGMSGGQLAEHLASQRRDMKILYMSGHTDNAIVRHGARGTGLTFLQKPFTPDHLARRVREVLDGQEDRI